MKKVWYLLLISLLATGCYSYNFKQVPAGVQQYPVDLQVAGLVQRYTVVAPQPAATDDGALRHPAMVLMHSGFGGDEHVSAQLARRLARRGVVVILPAYRGEVRRIDGKRSDGRIEFCRGEVDDAQAALAWLREQPFVDPQRLAALGASHGGCITLRLGEREPTLRALVTFSAPVAAAPLLQHLRDHPDDMFFFNGILAGWLSGYIQSSVKDHPEVYEERSPLSGIDQLRTPLLVFHGTQDPIVPMTQACWLFEALSLSGRLVAERWLDPHGKLYTPARSACPAAHPAQGVPTVDARTEFIFMEGQGHSYAAPVLRAAQDIAVSFLAHELQF